MSSSIWKLYAFQENLFIGTESGLGNFTNWRNILNINSHQFLKTKIVLKFNIKEELRENNVEEIQLIDKEYAESQIKFEKIFHLKENILILFAQILGNKSKRRKIVENSKETSQGSASIKEIGGKSIRPTVCDHVWCPVLKL